jgi:folate-binding protein YgfZ
MLPLPDPLALPTPLSPSALAAFDALHQSAVVLARPELVHLAFIGPKAGDVLTGLVTNDVLALAPGDAQYAVTLTAKGKVIADLRIARVADERYLTTSAPPSGEAWYELVRKFVNPRFARYARLSSTTVSCFGPAARAAIDRALDALRAAGHVLDEMHVLPSHELGDIGGVDVVLSVELADVLLDLLRADPSVIMGDPDALEVVRIAAGRPRVGLDMDDSTIPQEANLGDLGALSFTKGCYTGQETVARLHFRGHVNKSLRRVRAKVPFPRGAELRTIEDKVIGDVRSTAISPVDGPIGLAMIRREVLPGAIVHAHWNGVAPIAVTVLS